MMAKMNTTLFDSWWKENIHFDRLWIENNNLLTWPQLSVGHTNTLTHEQGRTIVMKKQKVEADFLRLEMFLRSEELLMDIS